MTEHGGIVDALADVMSRVQAVGKSGHNPHGNYDFRGIDAVVNAVGPALRAARVVVVPAVQQVEYSVVETSRGKPANACRVTVSYTFYHGAESLTAVVAAEAWDHGDKAAPKAMSVALRTALLQALCLPTDEPDPDSATFERAERQPAADVASEEAIAELGALLFEIDSDRRAKAEEWIRNRGGLDSLSASDAETLLGRLRAVVEERRGDAEDAAQQLTAGDW